MLVASALQKATLEELTSLPSNLKGRVFILGSKMYYNNGTSNIELLSVAGAGGVDIGTYTIFNTHGGTVDYDSDYYMEANGKLIDDAESPLDGKYIDDLGNPDMLNKILDYTLWTSRTSSFGADDIYRICYGNGLYIAAGTSGKLATSPDGITWTSRTSGFGGDDIYGICYGNGLYVVVGKLGKLATSGIANSPNYKWLLRYK